MYVSSINYQRTVNLGNYENEKLGGTVLLLESEKPADALELLRAFIDGNVATADERQEMTYTVAGIRREVSELETKLETLRNRWAKAVAFLNHHGIDVADDIPF